MALITQRRMKRFLFVGPTGVGKSALINILFNDYVKKSSLLQPAGTSAGSTACFTTYYDFPDYALTDSIGLGTTDLTKERFYPC
jgi:predicted GTPase